MIKKILAKPELIAMGVGLFLIVAVFVVGGQTGTSGRSIFGDSYRTECDVTLRNQLMANTELYSDYCRQEKVSLCLGSLSLMWLGGISKDEGFLVMKINGKTNTEAWVCDETHTCHETVSVCHSEPLVRGTLHLLDKEKNEIDYREFGVQT